MNILTVIFVFATYQAQRNQIEDNKKDGEFNRVLDIIYKQLEYTKSKYNAQIGSSWSYKIYFNNLCNYLTTNSFIHIVYPNSGIAHYFDYVFNHFLVKEFEVYYRVINLNNHLSDDDKIFFTNLFVNNIDSNIMKNVVLFQELYYDFQKSEQYNIQKEADPNTRFNNIEKDLKLVLQYLNIPKIEGLKLD